MIKFIVRLPDGRVTHKVKTYAEVETLIKKYQEKLKRIPDATIVWEDGSCEDL